MNPLFELIQFSIGTRDDFPSAPDSVEAWKALLQQVAEHSLVGITFPAIRKMSTTGAVPVEIYYPWEVAVRKIISKNQWQRKAVAELYHLFLDNGFRNCILKGQAAAAYYPQPSLRQSGDIDIWLEGSRETIMEYLRSRYEVYKTRYIHCEAKVLDNVRVEVHFTPSWMFSPFANRRLQRWFASHSDGQFSHFDDRLGCNVPTTVFNAVYMLLHIYRHVMEEGIGLRQLLDYYYVLKRLDETGRQAVVRDLKQLRLYRFAGAVMFVLRSSFLAEESILICPPDTRLGKLLQESILESGNFGHSDPVFSNPDSKTEGILAHGWRKIKRNLRYLLLSPSEILWMPWFVTWQYFWRRKHGYLYKGR